jgi:SAM-dependent methyltransferase
MALVRNLSILAAVVVAGTALPAWAEDAARARFREIVPWLPKGLPSVGEVVAFEEHEHFVYLAGRSSDSDRSESADDDAGSRVRFVLLRPATLVVDLRQLDKKQHDIGEPTVRVELEGAARDGKTSKRVVCVYQSPSARTKPTMESRRSGDDGRGFTITTGNRHAHLTLPGDVGEPARIAVMSSEGKAILAERRFPNGVLPLGTKGMRLLDRWDSAYRGDSRPPWDKGAPSSHLKAAVESGRVKPGRAVVLGCGTGTNAIYLAKKGFDVTAIDIAPTALNLAEEKAKKANVKVRWQLADVVAPPIDLEPFDFIFDRGCYHGVRRGNARGYVEAAKRLSRPGTQLLILAGNANEERHYGPPRVKEEELRGDFSADFEFVRLDTVRFDSINPNKQGALAWSALLRRTAGDGSQ